MRLLLATRSRHKAGEIRRLLGQVERLELVTLETAGITPSDEEEEIERFDTFSENARAKALYFLERAGMPTLADDSGLEVDALDGAPGVRSKRFSPASNQLSGEDLDRANNEHLLELLGDLDLPRRTARFVCVAALARGPEDLRLFRGEAPGLILGTGRGRGGFGYDPLFFDRALGKTFAELSPEEKNRRSHRGSAFRAVASHLRSRPSAPEEWTESGQREDPEA